jgi:hypothetical protein
MKPVPLAHARIDNNDDDDDDEEEEEEEEEEHVPNMLAFAGSADTLWLPTSNQANKGPKRRRCAAQGGGLEGKTDVSCCMVTAGCAHEPMRQSRGLFRLHPFVSANRQLELSACIQSSSRPLLKNFTHTSA